MTLYSRISEKFSILLCGEGKISFPVIVNEFKMKGGTLLRLGSGDEQPPVSIWLHLVNQVETSYAIRAMDSPS